MIRVVLPAHLRTLARIESETAGEVHLVVEGAVTQRSILDALELRYPMLRGTLRDHVTKQRRPFVRFFACEQDLSHESPDAPLPEAVATGNEPFLVVGAIAGGAIGRAALSPEPASDRVAAVRVPARRLQPKLR
jgi:molybdopterin synthase sulfur carrier subunit